MAPTERAEAPRTVSETEPAPRARARPFDRCKRGLSAFRYSGFTRGARPASAPEGIELLVLPDSLGVLAVLDLYPRRPTVHVVGRCRKLWRRSLRGRVGLPR